MTNDTTIKLTKLADILATYRDEMDPTTFLRIVRDVGAHCRLADPDFSMAAFETACRCERPWAQYALDGIADDAPPGITVIKFP